MASTPHDDLFRTVFQHPREASALLRLALPDELLVHLDLRTLAPARGRFLTRLFAHREADLVFTAQLRERAAIVVVLVEHKSDLPRTLPLQVLGYVSLLLEEWSKENRLPLPVVLPIVVYHGVRRAPPCATLADLLDPSVAPPLLAWMPKIRVPILDLGRVPTERLLARLEPGAERAATTLVLMARIWSGDILDELRLLARPLRRSRRRRGGLEFERLLLTYILRAARQPPPLEELDEVMANEVDADARGVVMTLADQLHRAGMERGVEQGERQEARASLLRVLTLKFGDPPDALRARIEDADLDALREWLDAAVLARTIDDVF